ncbi:Hypothetical predicted protein [Pelobates cultripes]|uniref:Uncharacterized protein n=1 Tax=Pelobates cultripes TaxID=61616 RepID=A0AAD1WSE9_PELCU|nr:Hypothetical predicted protein [Pelobates cultripes]
MGGTKKRRDTTPSVATLFRGKEDGRPSLSQGHTETGSDSDDYEAAERHAAPLTKEDLKKLLKETSDDIKAYTAAALEKQIAGLKDDIEALTSRTSRTETQIAETQDKLKTHTGDIGAMQDKILYLEDGLEDLNNRSRRQNIRIRGLPESVLPETLLPTVRAIFQSLLPDASEQDLYIERAHRALRPPTYNMNAPRDIITKLLYFPIKERLMKAARDNPPTYQGQTLHFYQDLPPTTLQKRRDLKPLTTALVEKGWRYTWGHPFKLHVKMSRRVSRHTLSTKSRICKTLPSTSDSHYANQPRRPNPPHPQGTTDVTNQDLVIPDNRPNQDPQPLLWARHIRTHELGHPPATRPSCQTSRASRDSFQFIAVKY